MYDGICTVYGIAAWPPGKNSLELFGAILMDAGFRSDVYLSAVRSTAMNMGYAYSPQMEHAAKLIRRALKRGRGEDVAKLPIDAPILQRIVSFKGPDQFLRLIGCLIVVGTTLMLRSDELLHLKGICPQMNCCCDSHIHICGDKAVINIAGDKTNIEAKNVQRKLACSCSDKSAAEEKFIPACAVCAIKVLVRLATGERNGFGHLIYLAQGRKKRPLMYAGLRSGIHSLLERVGIDIRGADNEFVFGTHSMRRGGAVIYSTMGWPIAAVQQFGRWESAAVLRYCLAAPTEFLGGIAVRDLVKAVASVQQPDESGGIQLTEVESQLASFQRAVTAD